MTMCSAFRGAGSRLSCLKLLERCTRPAFTIRTALRSDDKDDRLGETTAVIQDGTYFHQLPIVLRRTVEEPSCKPTEQSNENLTEEDSEAIDSLNRCFRPHEIYSLLEVIPANEVTPKVALHSLQKIVELENINYFPDERKTLKCDKTSETFTRKAVVSRLIQTICSSTDSSYLLECLKVISKDCFPSNKTEYQEKICNESLIRMTENRLTVCQVCDIVLFVSDTENSAQNNAVEKLWPGITEKETEIDKEALMKVYSILPHLQDTQKLLYNLVERRTFSLWWELKSYDVANILTVLSDIRYARPSLLRSLAVWTNINVNRLSEEEMLKILKAFSKLSYVDEVLCKVLQRYMKIRAVKIEDPQLVIEIAEYIKKFRLRLSHVLNGIGEIVMKYGKRLPNNMIHSLVTAFGTLNYYPSTGYKFYEYIEDILDARLNQFTPDIFLDLLVSCVYQGFCPAKLVKRIYNPFFLDRLHSLPHADVSAARMLLMLFDNGMALECPGYPGPFLPKHTDLRSRLRDGRITRTINFLIDPLNELYPSLSVKILGNQHAEGAPLIDLYSIDILLRDRSWKKGVFNLTTKVKTNDKGIALLVRVPDHYCSNQKVLLGAQQLRSRHLKLLGYRVVEVDYEHVNKLRVFPSELQNYLKVLID